MHKFLKITLALIIIAIVLAVIFWDFSSKKITWGVTFSQKYTQDELGLDWKKTYIAILDDLKVSNIRLSAYWDLIEPVSGNYNFADLDYQINEADKRNVKIVLAVGRRLPRWPECHDPFWIKDMKTIDIQKKQMDYIESVINRYSSNPNIIYFQVENEPYLKYFGICPPLDKEFFKEEIKLVKSLSSKPILITDSGELSLWYSAGKSGGDVLGTTLYRVVYNKTLGYWKWFLPPSFYWTKAFTIKNFTNTKKIIVAELQGEAWHKAGKNLNQMSLDESFESMSLIQFQKNIQFSKKAGFGEIYLWGVEWWYFMKEKRHYASYWNEAKKLWQ